MRSRVLLIGIVALLVSGVMAPLVAESNAASLKPCSASQKAQVANYSRQYYSLADLRKLSETKLSQAKLKYESASATGNASSAALAKLDMQSAQGSIDSYNRQMTAVRAKQDAITKTCKYDATAAATGKKSACTSSVRYTLSSLASQYQYQQDLRKMDIEGMDASRIKYNNAISRGKMSDAQKYNLDYSNYLRDLQSVNLQASLIKEEFDNYNSSCTGSGVSLPPDYVAPPDPSAESSTPATPTKDACTSASCMPSAWSNSQSMSSGNAMPFHETADYSSGMTVTCINRGSGSIGVTNARIVMAFTASTSWKKNYLSTPVENDFFQKDSEIGGASSDMKYFDVPAKVVRYDTTPLATDYKKIQYIPAATLTTHLCDAKVPFVFDVDKKISPNIAGVGFFYLSTISDGRTLMIFMSGYDVQHFMTPRFTAKFSNDENQITYSGKALGVSAMTGGTDFIKPNAKSFGSFCFRIDGNEKTFPCDVLFNNVNDFSGTLSTSSLSSGSHTLEMYVPTAPDKEISTAKYTFTLTRKSTSELDAAARLKVDQAIATCTPNFLGAMPLSVSTYSPYPEKPPFTMTLTSTSWGKFDETQISKLKPGELATLDLKYLYIPLTANWVNPGPVTDINANTLVVTVGGVADSYQPLNSSGSIWRTPWPVGEVRTMNFSVPLSLCGKPSSYVFFHPQG
ncbi:MAG: hypothetical protein WCI25_04290 [Actinomycetes bacterium]